MVKPPDPGKGPFRNGPTGSDASGLDDIPAGDEKMHTMMLYSF